MRKESKEIILLSKDVSYLPKDLNKLIYFLGKIKNNKHYSSKDNLRVNFSIENDGYDNCCFIKVFCVREESNKELEARLKKENETISKENKESLKTYFDNKSFCDKMPGITVIKPKLKKLHKT